LFRARIKSSAAEPVNLAGSGAVVDTARYSQDGGKMPSDPELIDDLVAANRILYDQGVVDGFGHVSARHDQEPARFLLARSIAPGLVTADDIMEFDLDGNVLDPRTARFMSNASSTARSTRHIPRSTRSCTAIRHPSFRLAPPPCRCGRSII
jgi:class II aldolase/adducin N-terminal domain-containing protein